MIEHSPDSIPFLAKIKDAIYSLVLFGVTQQVEIDIKMIASSIIVGVLAAFGSSYVAADRTSTKLDNFVREQSEFRIEMRDYMKARNAEILALHERQARTEAMIATYLGSGQGGMGGMGGMGGRK